MRGLFREMLSWWTNPRKLLRAILLLDDTPKNIAAGAALGMFIALTPTVGVQMLLVVAIAMLLQRWVTFSKMAALFTVYVSNPLTIVPIYWFDYKVGTYFFDGSAGRHEFSQILDYGSFGEWCGTVAAVLFEIGLPLFAGSLIVGSIAAAVTYPAVLFLLRRVRQQSSPPKYHRPHSARERSGQSLSV